MMQIERHFMGRSGWLRALVLGANDGIVSTACLVIGVAAAASTRNSIVLAALAGLVAGALSMAAGEYVSVSSQSDIEESDLKREKEELETQPDSELTELANIYKERGLDDDLAMQVAIQLTKKDALAAHARDELGINKNTKAKPFQAVFASGISFTIGGVLPLLVALFAPIENMVIYQYVFAVIFLALLGSISAKTGGTKIVKSILRICFWGTMAMAISALVGYLFGVSVA